MRTFHVDTGKIWRGGQRQCAFLCRHLTEMGQVTALACRSDSPLAKRFESELPRDRLLKIAPAGELDLRCAHRLAGQIDEFQPDLLAAHDAHAFSLLIFARIFLGRRLPLVYHRRVDIPVARWFGSKWKMDRADQFICVSRRIGEILAECGISRDRIRVVHSGTPGVEPSASGRSELCAELGLPSEAKILGAVGGLIPHKGHAVLLDAFSRVASSEGNCRLCLVGDGPLRGELERQAEKSGVADSVFFLGERRDLERLFGAFDLFVHPSLTEGLGTSILDAFSANVPVVASETGGIPEMVTMGKTGRLVAPGYPKLLADGLREALGDPEGSRRMASAARELFLAEFTDQDTATKTAACYSELLGAGD
jgi:L-malate glycosyltransferase